MADFGQNRLWPKPTLAKPTLANPTLAKPTLAKPSSTCVCVCVCVCLCVCVLCVCVCWFHGFRVGVSRFWFGHVRCPSRDRPSRDRPSRDRPSRDRPSWDRPSRDRPSRDPPPPDRPPPDRPKFRSFFSLSRRKIRSFLPSLGVFSLNFGGVFEDRDPEMCTFGLSGCRVKPRRPHQTGPPGLAHDSPRTPNVHISGSRSSKTPPKFNEKTPREGRKERILRWEREKKARNFGPPTLRGPTLLGPTLRGPTLRGPTLRTPSHDKSKHTKKPKQLISKNPNN